jgi:hypothetical protein
MRSGEFKAERTDFSASADVSVLSLSPNPFENRENFGRGRIGRTLSRGQVAEGTERPKTLLEAATGIYSEIGESKEVLSNTRAYACLRCLQNKA